jgi:transcriptional regulator with XRE-family HTH domain
LVGLSQATMATEIGVTQPTLSRYESGDIRPRGRALVAYSSLLRDLRVLVAGMAR